MSRILFIIFAFCGAIANHMFAFEVDGIYYALNPSDNNTVYVCKSETYANVIKIPSKVVYGDKEFAVTGIEEGAFFNCKRLRSVSIPNTVSEIPNGAFANCIYLDIAELPNTIKSIGRNAFQRTNITFIELPQSLSVIHKFAFSECRKLKQISIPGSVKNLNSSIFYNCRSLKKVIFEDSSLPLRLHSEDDRNTNIFYNCPVEDVYLGRRIVFLGRNYNVFSEAEGRYIETNLYDGGQITSKKQYVCKLRLGKYISSYMSQFKYENDCELENFRGLQEIHISNPNPPEIYPHLFTLLKEKCVLYVPKSSKSNYEIAPGWDVFYTIKEE